MAHIPSGTTAQMELVTFRQAMEAANTPNDAYDIGKWIYAPNFYSEYRYILGTRGKNPLICIGINPSTARPDALDNTLKSVERIALGNGFDSFIMFNVYAQRATSPDDMEKVCCPSPRSLQSGPPGVPSLKSGSIFPAAYGICCWPVRITVPSGTAPEPLPKRAIPTTRCTYEKTKKSGLSM